MMKRILVFSDSHGDTSGMCRVIERIIGVDLIVHCGDYSKDAVFLRKAYPDIPVISVKGNNEYGATLDEPSEIIEMDNVRIFVTHGHHEGVKSGIDTVLNRAILNECSVCLFGHTHKELCVKEKGVLLLNPGSAKGHGGTFGVIEIENSVPSGAYININ